MDARVLPPSGTTTAYAWATAYEFWRGRSEPLVSRWPAIFMLFAHGALFLLRTPLAQVLPWSPANQVVDSVWLMVNSSASQLSTVSHTLSNTWLVGDHGSTWADGVASRTSAPFPD